MPSEYILPFLANSGPEIIYEDVVKGEVRFIWGMIMKILNINRKTITEVLVSYVGQSQFLSILNNINLWPKPSIEVQINLFFGLQEISWKIEDFLLTRSSLMKVGKGNEPFRMTLNDKIAFLSNMSLTTYLKGLITSIPKYRMRNLLQKTFLISLSAIYVFGSFASKCINLAQRNLNSKKSLSFSIKWSIISMAIKKFT